MANPFIPGALLGHVYELEDGTQVRLRLARTSGLAMISELLATLGANGNTPSAARLVQFDPRREYVVCATTLRDRREVLLGVGRIALDDGISEPEVIVADGANAEETRHLLATALLDTASAISRSRAA